MQKDLGQALLEDSKHPGPTHVFHRGSPENPRDEVPPAAPLVLVGDLTTRQQCIRSGT